MDQNLMALLSAVLSGQKAPLSGQQSQAPMQTQAMQPMPAPMAQPMMPAQQSAAMGQGYTGGPMRPLASEQNDHGNDGGITPGVDPGTDDGGGKGDGKGGKGNNNDRLSRFEKQMRKIGNKGPRAYTNAIEKNLGFNEPTVGYGKTDPSTFKTGMANSLASVLTGTPQPDPNQPVKMY